MFTRSSKNGNRAVLIVYVDNIILTGDDQKEIVSIKDKLSREFEIKDLKELRYFLGMEIARFTKGIAISQQKYVIDLLKDTGMSGYRPVDTLIDPNQKFEKKKTVPQLMFNVING